MKILESAENYLETILILQKRNGTVRSIDIASELEYTKPSVSVAMKNLRENGYIEMDKMGHITLMETGLAIAEAMYERHTALSTFLSAIGVSEHTAREDACRMEHIISEETFEAIKKHTQYLIAKQSENKYLRAKKQTAGKNPFVLFCRFRLFNYAQSTLIRRSTASSFVAQHVVTRIKCFPPSTGPQSSTNTVRLISSSFSFVTRKNC